MYFTNHRSIPKHTTIQTNVVQQSRFGLHVFQPTQPVKLPLTQDIQTTVDVNTKKILWGPAVWFFFHTLAEKIKPGYFSSYREGIFTVIKDVCSSLPCPSCTTHAVEYINNVNFNSIQTKDDLKHMLFNFHNEVNIRTKKSLFSYDELNSKYQDANFKLIVNYFLHYYKMQHVAVRQMHENIYRQHVSTRIVEWLQSNMHIFEM